jgi:hypothetical protein
VSALNLHRLLAGTASTDGFQQNISLTVLQRAGFTAARDTVRGRLRRDFKALSEAAPAIREQFLEKAVRTTDRAAELVLQPKFRWQGSFAYHTINSPAFCPPQQVDLDDGVYLPTSFINSRNPTVAADAFFTAVENSLRPLCRERGWTLSSDTKSCVRVVLGTDAHLDLPLYAVPDDQFQSDVTLAKDARSGMLAEAQDLEVLSEAQYAELPADHIMLALRSGEWEHSDPRKLEDWFRDAKREHGDVLRFTCRYLKAWRDYQWETPKSGPSSICLMACAVQAFEDAGTVVDESREDEALQLVASRLPDILRGRIPNPAVPEAANLDDDWQPQKRQEFVVKATHLHNAVVQAMNASSPESAVTLLRRALGDRLPNEPRLVQTEEEARILSTPARQVPAPVVARSTSG